MQHNVMEASERCASFSDNHTTYEALIFDLIQHSTAHLDRSRC